MIRDILAEDDTLDDEEALKAKQRDELLVA